MLFKSFLPLMLFHTAFQYLMHACVPYGYFFTVFANRHSTAVVPNPPEKTAQNTLMEVLRGF